MQQHTTWIHNLLDGELNAHDEPSLFGELSVNPDLRHEFKQQLAIRSAVQQDRMALVPPAHLTNTVFSGLGFAAPMAGAAAGAAGGGFLIPWLLKLGLPILSAAAAVGITMAVSDAPTNQNRAQNIDASSQQVSDGAVANGIASDGSSNNGSPVLRTTDDDAALDALRNENRRLRGELASAQARRESDLESAQARRERDLASAQARNERDADKPLVTPTPSSPSVSTPIVSAELSTDGMQPVAISTIDLKNTTTFSSAHDLRAIETQIMPAPVVYTDYASHNIQVRGFAASPLSDVNVPAQNLWYENFAAAWLIELSPRNTVGVEVGTESFAQRFEGQRNGQIIRYEQRPSSFWAGVLYRQTFGSFGDTKISPFAQGFVGGTQHGPLARVSSGILYAPSGPLSFIIGIEYSMLGYRFQETLFTSSKLGLTYGMAVRL